MNPVKWTFCLGIFAAWMAATIALRWIAKTANEVNDWISD